MEQDWKNAFPAPTSTAPSMSKSEVLTRLLQSKPSIMLVDVRRNDFEVVQAVCIPLDAANLTR